MPIGKKNPIRDVMHEFKRGSLHSGKGGPVVKSHDQAMAIAMSEARKKGKKVPKRRKGK